MTISNIFIRNATINEIFEIHEILSKSFNSYKKYYTQKALNETVISPKEIEKRINDITRDVLIDIKDKIIVGPAIITQKEKNSLYISSTAVRSEYQLVLVGISLMKFAD